MLLLGIFFLGLLAFAMQIDLRKKREVRGFAVVELLLVATVASVAIAIAFLIIGFVSAGH